MRALLRFSAYLAFALLMFAAAPAFAQRATLPFWWPLTNAPRPFKALLDRVNDLSAVANTIDGGSTTTTAPRFVVGGATLAAGAPGAFVDLLRFTPGASKRGAILVSIVGSTSTPSEISVHDRIEWVSDGSGTVYVMGMPGSPPGSAGGTGAPGAPSAPGVTVNSTNIALTWSTVANVSRGWELLFSLDGGSSYSVYGRRLARDAVSATFTGYAGAVASVKFKLRAFNAYGYSVDSSVTTTTTGASHTSAVTFVTDSTLVPAASVTWDDLHPYIYNLNGTGGNSGDALISASGLTTALAIRARAQNNKTGSVRYVFDMVPAQ